ncbi:zinc fingers and homeoboxes protein 3 [Aplochiton taeniatus]
MTLNFIQPTSLSTYPLLSYRTPNQSLSHPYTGFTMASKRKSTVPCMIPTKTKHMREEIILGCLPELLPTIPEDSILSISEEESSHFSHDSSRSEVGDRRQKRGSYNCPPCRFDTRDLNNFLDHMHNYHVDFRAQPSFYCLNCGVSVFRFETLALHNAKAHPGLAGGYVNASLHVKRRDGLTTVEQSLFTDRGDDHSESGISLTKTPIVKMMKGKGEHKKIVVSHTVEVRRIDTGMEIDPNMLTNVPELCNGARSVTGAPAIPTSTVTHVTTTTVPKQVHHQHTPALYCSPAESTKDLPKVMIPLSSIPTYNAAMDTSSFLKTSFGKFPYPTKAELCYLTVVSDFPEEQIKLWFTAQRLKQGISWSPEEIEEARRKMFSTVFQGAEPQKQPSKQRHVNHVQHTVTAQPTLAGPNHQTTRISHSSLTGRPTAVIATQGSMLASQQVTRVTYAAPALPTRYSTVVQTAQVMTKNAAPALESEKSMGAGLDMSGSSCIISTNGSRSSSSSSCSSSSSISSFSSYCNGGENGTRKPINNGSSPSNSINSIASCSTNISNNDEHSSVEDTGKANDKNNLQPESDAYSCNKSKVIINYTSKSNIRNNHSESTISVQEQYNKSTNANDDGNNNYIYQTNNGSIGSDCLSSTHKDSVHTLNNTSLATNESTSTTVIAKGSDTTNSTISNIDRGSCVKEFPIKGMSILQQLIREEDQLEEVRSCPELKVDPVKIIPRRLHMNDPDATLAFDMSSPELKPEPQTSQLSFPTPWDKKTPHQVNLLRQVFSSTRWPSSQQYEELSAMTGLPKPEVVRWFSDGRYIHKNGQLKWLENYQHLPVESEENKGHAEHDAEAPEDPQVAPRKCVEQEEVSKQLEGGPGYLNSGQWDVWQDTYKPLPGLMAPKESAEGRRTGEMLESGALQHPWLRREEDKQKPAGSQAIMGQQTEANQARDRLRMGMLEV